MTRELLRRAITYFAPAAGFVVALALLLVVAVLSYHSVDNAVERTSWVQHTQKVKAAADEIQASLLDSESAARGYIISGEAAFVEPHRNVRDTIQSRLRDLIALTSDNPSQQRRLQELVEDAKQRIALSDQMIYLQQSGRHDDAVKLVKYDTGKALMDRIRERISAIKAEENSLLTV